MPNESNRQLDVVTGAFGYSGQYIARRLLALGRRVRTLTRRSAQPALFQESVEVAPLCFDRPDLLVQAMAGATTLYNTYWVRFERGGATFARAVENTKILLKAARRAGIRKVVHLSVSNPAEDSPLDYYRGKAEVERAIRESGLPYAIVRPTVIFGREDILINNIAWFLRRFPVFAVPGSGKYGLQPVFAGDVAELAVRAAEQTDDIVFDAAGPEIYTFEGLVRLLAQHVGRRPRLLHVAPSWAHLLTRAVGLPLGDVVLTKQEIAGLMANLLVSNNPPTAQTRFSDWIASNGVALGTEYSSELARHFQ
jgi:uncharacterized protein YbjT (DUF2867 family)